MHNDDTHMRILELTEKIKNQEPLREDDPDRSGVFTTNILSVAESRPTISLFFTGPRHSGENLHDLLTARVAGLPPPMQMCDALSRNLPGDLKTIVANCLSHARRNFYELKEVFPAETLHVLECFKTVYLIDRRAKQQAFSPQDRLLLHQEQSRPVMKDLQKWLRQQFDERRVEPNSSLGKAIKYMLKHWEKLTLFLHVPGAPLDNNICERALKMSIKHRKNSLFYKTQRGAQVGDIYMSLIHTCQNAQADPFDYLTQLQRHRAGVIESPADWFPWNYRQQPAVSQ
jgi:transposase